MSRELLWVVLAGLVVGGAIGGYLIVRDDNRRAREADDRDIAKLQDLKIEAMDLKIKLMGMQTDLATDVDWRSDPPGKNTFPHWKFSRHEPYRKTLHALNLLVAEHNQILDRHPTWTIPRLTSDLDETRR